MTMPISAPRPDHRLPGKTYNITEAAKAASMGISTSWLQKDRSRKKPTIDYARYGGAIRYSPEP